MADTKSTDPLMKFRERCVKRGAIGIRGFSRCFRTLDDDKNGTIGFEEFSKGVRDFGVDIDKAEIKPVFDIFDKDGNGSIHMGEFFTALWPQISQQRLEIINEAFNKVDKTGDGVLTIDDLKGIYNVCYQTDFKNEKKTEKELWTEYVSVWESGEKDGKVTKDEFINYHGALSATFGGDEGFILMMRNAFQL